MAGQLECAYSANKLQHQHFLLRFDEEALHIRYIFAPAGLHVWLDRSTKSFF